MPDARAGSDKPVTADEAATLFAPLAAYSHLALAVSGGCDSVALMWLLARWSKVYAPQISISVLSVDHGLRDGARAEAEQAGQWARDYGFSHHILNWRGEKPQAGVQAAARKARYELLAGWCRAHGAQLVLAHHLDDQAETVLMRLFRGSGIDGLCGMSRQSWREGVRLLRPLLEVPKARLVATLQHAGQGWCEDPSNQDLKYERVRIRRGLESLARAGFDPASISMSAAALRPVREALDAAADALIANAGVVSPGGFAHLEAEALAQVAGETGLRVFRRFLRFAGGNAHPPRRRKLLRLFEVMRHDLEASATLAGCRVFRQGGQIWFVRELRGGDTHDVVLEAGRELVWDNRFLVSAPGAAGDVFRVRMLGDEGWQVLKQKRAEAEAIPAAAGRSLVSFWSGGELEAVPFAGYLREGSSFQIGDFKSCFLTNGRSC